MGDRFFDGSHARQKLHNTVCMYKGEPYYIHHDRSDETVTCYPLDGSKRPFTVNYTDKDFDYTTVPLGYINYGNSAFYLSREPQRVNQQGLTFRSIRSEPAMPFGISNDVVMSKAFRSCVLGDYLSLEEAIADMRKDPEVKKRAVSRHIAIARVSKSIFVAEYRGRAIAVSEDRGSTFRITDAKASHLYIKRFNKAGLRIV